MNAAVILAAGESSIMGFPKLLAEVKDIPLLQFIIDKVHPYYEELAVVLGSDNEVLSETIDFHNSTILINENWEEGVISSLRTALYFFQGNKKIENLIIFLGDQPEVKEKVIKKFQDSSEEVLISQYRYKLSYPISIPRKYWGKLELLTNDDETENITTDDDFDLIHYFVSSEVKFKKVNFNFLGPTDYNEEKDF